MKRKRRVEVVFETERRVTLRSKSLATAARCGRCSGPMLCAEEAVALTGINSRAIHRMAEAGEVHFVETPEGALLVCLVSLRDAGVASVSDNRDPRGCG